MKKNPTFHKTVIKNHTCMNKKQIGSTENFASPIMKCYKGHGLRSIWEIKMFTIQMYSIDCPGLFISICILYSSNVPHIFLGWQIIDVFYTTLLQWSLIKVYVGIVNECHSHKHVTSFIHEHAQADISNYSLF